MRTQTKKAAKTSQAATPSTTNKVVHMAQDRRLLATARLSTLKHSLRSTRVCSK
jgi:hypothetical protein